VRIARPADATGTHVSVSVSARVPEFLPDLVLVVIITSTLVVCLVLEGDVVVLRLSDMRLVNLTLRVNGQDENVNTMCIASGRPLVVVLSAAAVLCLDNLSLKAGC
jgi:NMD protein affecting ribosome stability and mRNA decay